MNFNECLSCFFFCYTECLSCEDEDFFFYLKMTFYFIISKNLIQKMSRVPKNIKKEN